MLEAGDLSERDANRYRSFSGVADAMEPESDGVALVCGLLGE
jgi:hypothetical protein